MTSPALPSTDLHLADLAPVLARRAIELTLAGDTSLMRSILERKPDRPRQQLSLEDINVCSGTAPPGIELVCLVGAESDLGDLEAAARDRVEQPPREAAGPLESSLRSPHHADLAERELGEQLGE